MYNESANADIALIVREQFDNYQRGDKIEDKQLIQEILNSDHANYVNRILLPTPKPELERASKKTKE